MILLTGATGYIGSHTWVELLAAGHQVVGVDNFSNSNPLVLERLKLLSGHSPIFYKGDVRDEGLLKNIFQRFQLNDKLLSQFEKLAKLFASFSSSLSVNL